MGHITEVRLTLAAFIYAIEIDLKRHINRFITPNFSDLTFLHDENLEDKLKKRFLKEFPGIDPKSALEDIIDFIDFQDGYTIILKNKNFFPDQLIKELQSITSELDKIAPIRNRVMHTRPLEAGDFPTVYSFVSEIRKSNFDWSTLLDTREKIESDPSYVLTLSIPTLRPEVKEAYHNLPIPDFDETGFIGRRKDVDSIKKLLLGNNRVVSIIGDGGIGKTALALKVLYDILDLEDKCPFDLIIWISSKSAMLTAKGIEEIEFALKDYGGVIEGLSEIIGAENSGDKLSEILEYFEVFNVLLVVDNLETILSEDIREFIRKAQMNAKLLITSRIGLGELEFRYPLAGLSETESILLIRQYANLKKSEILNQLNNAKIISIASKLHYNPLALKWFVNSVETGINPEEVLRNIDDLLNFCLSNVYGKLSEDSKIVLKTILASRKDLNDAQLVYLTGLPSIQLRKALNGLFATTFISRRIVKDESNEEIKYNVPDFSTEYILKKHPIDTTFIKEIGRKQKILFRSTSSIQRVSGYNEFGINSLTIRNTNEKVVARLITDSLKFSKSSKFEEALTKLEEAKSILPNYFEVYRVSAFIKATSGDILGAEQDYKMGMEIEPNNPRMLYFYAGFLLYQLDDVQGAADLAKQLYKLRPESEYPTFLLARCLSTIGENEAGIKLIKTLLKKSTLNKTNYRVAYTDLIGMHGYWGTEIIQKDGDFKLAGEKYILGLKYFEECVQEGNYDGRMIKNFCSCLKSFLKNIPKLHGEQYNSYLKELFIKYDDQISLNLSKNYLLGLAKNAYDISFDIQNRHEGKVISINKIGKFIFIKDQDGKEIYGNIKAFKYQNDFFTLKGGAVVLFDIGENKKGHCAINIEVKTMATKHQS